MVNIFSALKIRSTRNSAAENRQKQLRSQLISDIENCVDKLKKVRERYDLVCEDELIEALIYEEKALYARYSYLLRLAREQGIVCNIKLREEDFP